ncbi:type I restriction endonuclease subunit M [Chryseobacterium lactis]|uniref:site-specific DNA-methyltransferase (adenine-specific) n=1 Tax=Chryseobacterium lactis TaxID=1241981 RepID=A0A3G6RLW8_CHRLC|nr:methyltransferase [Chryseobacterium lactis]AZA82139.1 type I restriction endonuclease subunit M [Chryseobacterium lactis]AZB02520.1 type I restriction endonuclease subunit M [Chryseobacterium lactis]PNW14184.1 type I restriction endonuclease subunit M [Chryseobacterium lactis]
MSINNKETGSYYTPEILSDFLSDHILNNFFNEKKTIKILEPSCGDGIFVKSLIKKSNKKISFTICDINEDELNKTLAFVRHNKTKVDRVFNDDYLKKDNEKYDLVIGNPPYISKQHLNTEQILRIGDIVKANAGHTGEVKNIWPAFLIKNTLELNDNGVLCLVLPAELLQVKYTESIRKYILENFHKIEIFAFNELIFDNIEQDVIVFIGVKKRAVENNNVSFFQVQKLDDLKIPDYAEKNSNVNRKRLDKWTNYILSEEELDFIIDVTEKLNFKKVNHYCDKAEVGIVTAANDYFISTYEKIENIGLKKFSKEILRKSNLLKNSIILDKEVFSQIISDNKPAFLIDIKREDIHHKVVKDYLSTGVELEISGRYKMKKRNNWYEIPSTWSSDIFFVKRCHLYPKLIYNPENYLLTDSFYRIIMKKEYNVEHFVYSFYNTLTFIYAELEGRFYGGGVLELTPNEFKKVYMPYIDNGNLNELNLKFKSKNDIEAILKFNDEIILKNLNADEREKLTSIWKKLFHRRLKSTPLV